MDGAKLSAYLSISSGGVLHNQLAEPWAVKVTRMASNR